MCLPSHPPQLTDSTVRPGLGPALRLAKRPLSTSATAAMNSRQTIPTPDLGCTRLSPFFEDKGPNVLYFGVLVCPGSSVDQSI